MRGFLLFVLLAALVAVLIPFPGLLWFSLAAMVVIWLATPTSPRRGKGSS